MIMISTVLFWPKKLISRKYEKNSPIMLIWFHKITCYHLNKRVLWKLYLLYTDYFSKKFNFSKIEKIFSHMLYLAVSIRSVSIRSVSIMFDSNIFTSLLKAWSDQVWIWNQYFKLLAHFDYRKTYRNLTESNSFPTRKIKIPSTFLIKF